MVVMINKISEQVRVTPDSQMPGKVLPQESKALAGHIVSIGKMEGATIDHVTNAAPLLKTPLMSNVATVWIKEVAKPDSPSVQQAKVMNAISQTTFHPSQTSTDTAEPNED